MSASFFAFLTFLSGLVLVVQFLGALHALLLIESFSINLFHCASLGPWCSPLLPATSHILHSLMCEDLPSVSWFEHPTEGYDSRDRSLWFFAAHLSSTVACLMLSWHPPLCSLTSALICAVLHTSPESPPAGCTREYASCVHRESSVLHCLV